MVCGSQVTFTVTATTDAGTLTYQWQRNGANLDPPPVGVSGATTNTLTIDSVQESNTGVYTCVVSNAPSSTTPSNAAQLAMREFLNLVCLIQPICAKGNLETMQPCTYVCACTCVYQGYLQNAIITITKMQLTSNVSNTRIMYTE